MGLGLPFGCLWGALGATLGAKKATREAPRRVTGPFGGPKGFWKGPGVIFGVVLVSKKVHFEGSKPLDSIGRANRISIFRVVDTKMYELGSKFKIWVESGCLGERLGRRWEEK